MRVEFVGQSARDDDNPQANTARLINFYREPVGGYAGHALKSVLGTETFAETQLFGRSMASVNGTLYVMSGDGLYEIRDNAPPVLLGTTASAEGAMIFGAEFGRVCTVSDGRYFVWDGSVIDEPTAGAFSGYGSGLFIGNYVVLTEDGGRRFLWSDLADAKALPALNFATAESTDGHILRAMKAGGRLWLMKEDVIETWYITGQAGANALAQITGGVIEVGLKAQALAANFTGGLFFIGADDIAYISNGGQVQPVSGPAVNTSLAQSTPTHCFVYEDEGHKFCVVRFSDRPAWVYDIVTGEWHERASGGEGPWEIRHAAHAYGKWFGVDNLGKVYEFKRNGMDDAAALIRTANSATLQVEGRRFRVPAIEFSGRMGLGLMERRSLEDLTAPSVLLLNSSDQAIEDADTAATYWAIRPIDVPGVVLEYNTGEPTLQMAVSRDGGITYGLFKERGMGKLGEYGKRVKFRRLGSFYRMNVQVRVSDPVDVTIDARANVVLA